MDAAQGPPEPAGEQAAHPPARPPAPADAAGGDEGMVYALYQQGRDRIRRGNYGAAAEVLELAVQHEPQKASLHEALGRAYFGAARVGLARQEFEQALALNPADDYAHFGVGRCYERLGQLEDAAKHYKLASALSDKADYRTALARVAQRLGA